MKRVIRKSTPAILAALILFGCAAPGPSRQETISSLQDESAIKSGKVEPKARSAFSHAERAFRAKKFKAAVDGYQAIKKKFPGSAAYQLSSYRLGSIYYMTGNYPAASQEFQQFLAAFPQSDLAFDVTYNLAASEYQQGRNDRALELLRRLQPSTIRAQGPRRAEVVYQLGAQASAAQGNAVGAVVYCAAHLQLPLEETKRQNIERNVVYHLNQIQSVDELNVLLAQVSESTTRARIAERVSALSRPAAGMPGFAPLPGGHAQGVQTAGLTSATSGDRGRLGILLPLSGSLAQYGKRALDGILLATGVFRQESGADFEIFVQDTESNPVMAAQGVERLVHDHNVIGIIGPISWKESLAAGEKAQELGVLNLSLTGKEGISERGAYLFQNALTPRIQMENLARYCMQEKRFRRFAILAPDNKFGEDMATEFASVINRLGGRIVGYETYPPEAKDFQAPVQRLAGVSDPRFRKMESAKLEAYIKEQQEKTKRPSKARLPPIRDFDAIFLPDGPKAVAQIAASLAYFDVVGATLLGTSEWNSDQLYKRGGRLVEGAIFPGALQTSSKNSRQREFIRQYAEAYGSMPDLLAAQSYEAVELVAYAANASSGNRNTAVSELTRLSRFESPLGQLSFDNNRIALRLLPILSLEPGGNIVEQ